jgi:hypothetical protein
MTSADRRAQPRLSAEQTVQVTILGASDVLAIGRVEEISARGMRLLVDCRVEPGSKVQIDSGDTSLAGNVRYCRTEDRGFVIGLQLEAPTFRPTEIVRMLR